MQNTSLYTKLYIITIFSVTKSPVTAKDQEKMKSKIFIRPLLPHLLPAKSVIKINLLQPLTNKRFC